MKLQLYDRLYIDSLVRKRLHEVKLGESVCTLPWNATADDFAYYLLKSECKYVLLGLPEDIGVRANGGRGGAYSAWQPVLSTFLNMQSNQFLKGNEIMILGHVDFTEEMNEAKEFNFHSSQDLRKARSIVQAIDNFVSSLISKVSACDKEVIVVGGGHNNAFGCIKGCYNALKNQNGNPEKMGIINCDAHSDFRPLEGRHSGNAFSYAFSENYIESYYILGLHESYNSGHVLFELEKNKDKVKYTTFEDIYIKENTSFNEAIKDAVKFTGLKPAGIEIDLDSIQNIPSSAKTSSGISTVEARKFIYKAAAALNIKYFHIAEAAPVLSHIKTDLKTGKLVSYLITDFIKARNSYHQKKAYETTDRMRS